MMILIALIFLIALGVAVFCSPPVKRYRVKRRRAKLFADEAEMERRRDAYEKSFF